MNKNIPKFREKNDNIITKNAYLYETFSYLNSKKVQRKERDQQQAKLI